MDRDLASSQSGFSLMEAMVVLIVAGMALMLVFAVGGRATQLGFRIGRQALGVADGELAEDNLRTVMASMTLWPANLPLPPPTVEVDRTRFEGAPSFFRGDALLGKATLCAGAGPAHALRVDIQSMSGGDVVTCRVGNGPPTLITDLRPRRARFDYSTDGSRWSDHWTGADSVVLGAAAQPKEQALYIRLATLDGSIDIMDRAASGRPDLALAGTPTGPASTAGL